MWQETAIPSTGQTQKKDMQLIFVARNTGIGIAYSVQLFETVLELERVGSYVHALVPSPDATSNLFYFILI